MRTTMTNSIREGSTEASLVTYDHQIRLDPVRQKKLAQLANEHRLSPHDLIVKALDAYFEARFK
jgi:hypothetical protein